MSDPTGRIAENIESALGPLAAALTNSRVTDLCINQDGRSWVKERGIWNESKRFEASEVASLLRDIAYWNGESIDHNRPLLHARLPGGERVEAQFPPIVDAPAVSIRRHAEDVIELARFLHEDPAAEPEIVELFRRMVESKQSIIMCGAVGSGKSSALSRFFAHLAEQRPQDRLVTIEEVRELTIRNPNALRLEVRRGGGSMLELLEAALRSAPSWIVVGEIKTTEHAVTYLKATNLGHPTASTIHVETAAKALRRIVDLTVELHSVAQQADWVGRVVRWIVRLAERPLPDGTGTYRAIMEVVEANGYARESGEFRTKTHYQLETEDRL